MKKYAFIYGGAGGLITICSMVLGYQTSGGEGVGTSQVVGFLIMIVALSLFFFGIRRYRDQEQGGVIRFGKAFQLGLLMSLVAGIVYVIVWELYLKTTGYDFIGSYTSGIIEKEQATGASAEEIATLTDKLDVMKDRYANPLYRWPMTFLEIFTIALPMSLISAFFLRNPKGKQGKPA